MTPDDRKKTGRPAGEDDLAAQVDRKQTGMLAEFFGLLRHNRKWWLTPIIGAAILLGALMLLLATPLSPLIYSLF